MFYCVDPTTGQYFQFDDDAPSIYWEHLTICPQRPSEYWNWTNGQWVLDLPRIQNVKWNAIKAERDRRSQYGGVYVNSHWISSELGSKIAVLCYVAAGDNLPTGLEHPTMENGSMNVTKQLAQDMLSAILANESSLYVAMNTHKANMLASENPETYVFTTGWPETFSGS